MSVKDFFCQLAKDIKDFLKNTCICCTLKMANESRIVPISVCMEENKVTNDMNDCTLTEVIVDSDINDIENQIIDEDVTVRSRKIKTPKNKTPIQNDFVIIYHTDISEE